MLKEPKQLMADSEAISDSTRTACPHCSASCFPADKNCWQCGLRIKEEPKVKSEDSGASDLEIAPGLIRFGDDPEPEPVPVAETILLSESGLGKKTRVTMSGEVVEEEQESESSSRQLLHPSMLTGSSANQSSVSDKSKLAGSIGTSKIFVEPGEEVMILSYCKHCGHQNPEGLKECEKCANTLDVVAINSVKEMEQLPRAWGFDVLGLVWIILGFAAVYAGQFLVKYDKDHPGTTVADYLWTGFVVCAPGIFIFMRHYFCKLLFWVLTLASGLVWCVIGFIWIIGKLQVSDNMQVTLIWLAVFSFLSLISWYTVRSNDAFDAGM